MTSISFTYVLGLNNPYTVYVCDVFGNNCILLAYIATSVPIVNTMVLPPQFNSAPAIGIKIITSNGCEKFKIFYCSEDVKEFMDLDDFYFMDNTPYFFMN